MVYVENEEPTRMSMSTFQAWAPGMFRQCWELGNITRSNAPLLVLLLPGNSRASNTNHRLALAIFISGTAVYDTSSAGPGLGGSARCCYDVLGHFYSKSGKPYNIPTVSTFSLNNRESSILNFRYEVDLLTEPQSCIFHKSERWKQASLLATLHQAPLTNDCSLRGQLRPWNPSPPDWASESDFLEDLWDHAGFSSPFWLLRP